MAHAAADARLIPARPSPRVTRFFTRHAAGMFRRRFAAVRWEKSGAGADQLRAAASAESPAVIAMNHSSWWDPLLGLVLQQMLWPGRPAAAPMDADQLERFGFFRRLGVFGVDPDDPRSLGAMRSYVCHDAAQRPGLVLWITPEGRFTDSRDRPPIRPGAASVISALAGEHERVCVAALGVEYCFWEDKKPEVFLRADAWDSPRAGRSAEHVMLQSRMRENQDRLASAVKSRDPARFEIVERFGRPRGSINPVMDAVHAVRGQRGAIPGRRDRQEVAT